MRIKQSLAALAIAGAVVGGSAACTPGTGYAPQSEYCVDNYGDVVNPSYCAYGYTGPHSYMLFMGSGHYHVGSVIPRTVYVHHTINPYSASARRSVGLSPSSVIHTGATVSKPASPGYSPTRTTTKPSVTRRVTTRVKSFGSSFRSSRSRH